MKAVGKLLQIAGLAVPLLAIFGQLSGSVTLGQMLMFLVASVAAFYLGRILEGYAKG